MERDSTVFKITLDTYTIPSFAVYAC